jgi:hypothetical protein
MGCGTQGMAGWKSERNCSGREFVSYNVAGQNPTRTGRIDDL